MSDEKTSPCVDPDCCEWAYNGGDLDVGVEGCWVCKTCGDVDIHREPPSHDNDDIF